jgi:hypothetical protein
MASRLTEKPICFQGKSQDDGSRKDANEVLLKDGPLALRKFLDQSRPYPIQGLHQFSDFRHKILEAYNGLNHADKPVSTGWKVLDEFYRVVPGELTIVTGVATRHFLLSGQYACLRLVWMLTGERADGHPQLCHTYRHRQQCRQSLALLDG